MPIASSDLQMRLSGGAANSDPNASLGGVMSSTAVTSGASNNLWDDVSGSESSAGDIEYRGFYWRNGHGTLTLQSAVTWIDALTTSADTEFDIALAAEAVGATMASIADESTAPSSVTFSRPTSKATGLSIGNMAPGDGGRKGVWIRRTVNAGAAAASDSGSVRLEGDTNP